MFLKHLHSIWKWLEPSSEDNVDPSSSLHFWSALTNFFSRWLFFSNDFIVLDRDLIVLDDLLLATVFSSFSSSLPFLRASMIFDWASGLSAFHSVSFKYSVTKGKDHLMFFPVALLRPCCAHTQQSKRPMSVQIVHSRICDNLLSSLFIYPSSTLSSLCLSSCHPDL